MAVLGRRRRGLLLSPSGPRITASSGPRLVAPDFAAAQTVAFTCANNNDAGDDGPVHSVTTNDDADKAAPAARPRDEYLNAHEQGWRMMLHTRPRQAVEDASRASEDVALKRRGCLNRRGARTASERDIGDSRTLKSFSRCPRVPQAAHARALAMIDFGPDSSGGRREACKGPSELRSQNIDDAKTTR